MISFIVYSILFTFFVNYYVWGKDHGYVLEPFDAGMLIFCSFLFPILWVGWTVTILAYTVSEITKLGEDS